LFINPNGFSRQEVWWCHSQALTANDKLKEGNEALDRAYDFLLDGIGSVRDVGLRRCFLNKVEVNREILQHWLSEAKKRKLPKERMYSYLNLESNTREPFTRLTDSSQRLNALKTILAIQAFLVEEATELSGCERVMLIREDGKKLEVAESFLPKGEEADNVLAAIKKHLDSARLTRYVQLILPSRRGISRIIAPLIAQNQIIGYLYADMDSIYGLLDETDRDMLGMLANQAAVALDNAGLVLGIEMVYQDSLTGIYNRRYFDEKMPRLFADAKTDGSSLSILFLDVDKFKTVNDTYGHQTGDIALRIIADCLRVNSRKHDLVFRLGGDEFALVMIDATEKVALLRAEKLCEEIRGQAVGNQQNQINLTMSVGAATLTPETKTLSGFLKQADIALYRAKLDGRNCVRT
jgi:diguanylate cyclase (GGDEF)-like protein